jgi:hypothetical protein
MLNLFVIILTMRPFLDLWICGLSRAQKQAAGGALAMPASVNSASLYERQDRW